MEYPKNGSVLIIDDKYEEVAGLISILNQNKVPTFYFNGNIDHFPEDGFENIRLIFLDINLEDDSLSGGREKLIVSKLMAVLRKAINARNGHYLVATWSSMSDTYYDALLSAIESDKLQEEPKRFLYAYPNKFIKLNKADVKSGDNFDLEKIKIKLDEELEKNSFFPYYISWENMVLESSKKVLEQFDALSDETTNIEKIIALFANGSNMIDSESEEYDVLKYGFAPLSVMLIDELQNHIFSQNRLQLIDEASKQTTLAFAKEMINKEIISEDEKAKINTLYHISNISDCSGNGTCGSSGTVYLYTDYLAKSCSTQNCNTKWAENLHIRLFEKGKKGILKINRGDFDKEYASISASEKPTVSKDEYVDQKIQAIITNEAIPIFLEISPACDVAQDKRKKMRLIFGILLPSYLKFEKPENITDKILIQYNSKKYHAIFDLHTVTAINFDVFADITPIFKFKKEFVTDIQHKVGNHISRPGFFNMADYN